MTTQNVTNEIRGRDLLHQRKKAGLRQIEIIEALGWTKHELHRLAWIEQEKVLPTAEDVAAIQSVIDRIVDERMAGVGA